MIIEVNSKAIAKTKAFQNQNREGFCQ